MDSEDMLYILYTSGTTGKPKGIVHTTGGYLTGVHLINKWVFRHEGRRCLLVRRRYRMADVPQALRQVRRVLQPEAVFILEYTNKQNIKAILRYWLGWQSWSPFTPEPVEFADLNFDFHPKAIRMWLEEVGFLIERQLTISHFRMDVLKHWIPLGHW